MYLTLLIRVLNEDNLNMTEICHCKHFLVWCIRSKSGIGKVKRQAYSMPSINHRHINLGIERDNRKWSENMATRKMFAKAWNYLKAISKEKEDEGKKTYKSTTKHQRLHKRRHRKCHEHAKNRNIIIIFLYSNKRFEEEEEEVNEKNMYKYDQSLKGVARKKRTKPVWVWVYIQMFWRISLCSRHCFAWFFYQHIWLFMWFMSKRSENDTDKKAAFARFVRHNEKNGFDERKHCIDRQKVVKRVFIHTFGCFFTSFRSACIVLTRIIACFFLVSLLFVSIFSVFVVA